MKHNTRYRTALVSLCLALMASGAGAQTPAARDGADDALEPPLCKKPKGSFTVNFKAETDLKELIEWAKSFTCKNFMHDSSISTRSKKVVILAPQKMTADEAYKLFLASLSSMGLTVVPKGNMLKIVESGAAKTETVPIVRGGAPSASDQMVRFVMRPSYMTADMMNSALSLVKSKDGQTNVVGSSIVITDYGSHVRDMMALARELDRPSAGEGIYTIPVVNSDARDIQTKISEILGIGAGAGQSQVQGGKGKPDQATAADVAAAVPSKILVDERSNTLIVVSSKSGYLRVRALAKRLDVAIAGESSGSIHIYPLENSKADELAQVLNAAISGAQTQGKRGGPSQGGTTAAAPTRAPEAGAIEGQVKVSPDAATNSLIVTASSRDFVAIKEVIRKLDMPRRQVYIEGVILEVNVDRQRDLGVSGHGALPRDIAGTDSIVLGGVQPGGLSSLNPSSLVSLSGLLGGVIGPQLTNGQNFGLGAAGISIPSFAILFQALAKNSNVNVLSTPFVMATDNKEALLEDGQKVPYAQGSQSSLGTTVPISSTSVAFADAKLSLKITPHVNESDTVRLEIDGEFSDIGAIDPSLRAPSTIVRKVKTEVSVSDQSTIVIGGLMRDRATYTESKVPLLGDIPVLGYLFKGTSKSVRKTNLLIVLTPHVVKSQLDLESILSRKTREHNEFTESIKGLHLERYLPNIDYRRKHGLLESINQTLASVDHDRALLDELSGRDKRPEGLIQYDVPDDEEDSDEPTSAPVPPTKPSESEKKPASADKKSASTKTSSNNASEATKPIAPATPTNVPASEESPLRAAPPFEALDIRTAAATPASVPTKVLSAKPAVAAATNNKAASQQVVDASARRVATPPKAATASASATKSSSAKRVVYATQGPTKPNGATTVRNSNTATQAP